MIPFVRLSPSRRLAAAAIVITALSASVSSAVASQGAAPPANATPAATTAANRDFISKAFAAWAAGGSSFFTDVLSPDVVWTIQGSSPFSGTYRSRDELLQRGVLPLTSRLSTPIRPTVRHLWAEGDHVIAHWDGIATTADGQPYRNSYVWILRLQNQRAVEVTAFLDMGAYDEVVRRVKPKQ